MSFSPTQQHPQAETILVLALTDGTYRELATLSGDAVLQSPQLGALGIAIADIFAQV